MLLELGVDQSWDRLVRRRPIAVSAAEDAVLYAGKRIRRQRRVPKPLAELGSVIWRLTVLGCGDDDHSPFFRQRTDVVIERSNRSHEPAVPPVLGDGMGQALGCAQVGAIKHQQPRLMPV
jgi:hypothetical protein